MPDQRKTILFILQRAPYGSSAARETLDAALAAAAFEQTVQLLFTGDGVWQLLPAQQPEAIGSKDSSKMLQALDYYDIEAVYADAVSLAERGLSAEQSAIPVTALSGDALKQLIQSADCVIAL
jgi:tRNA 2-thiouridine synthesizing protein C